jgi:hypothetical protein
MKGLSGLLGLSVIVGGVYYVAAQFIKNQEFEKEAVSLMKKQGGKVLEVLEGFPGCRGHFYLDSSSFRQDGFWSKTGEGRLFYLSHNNNVLNVNYKAEIVEEGRRIFVSPRNVSDLQALLTGLVTSGCRE